MKDKCLEIQSVYENIFFGNKLKLAKGLNFKKDASFKLLCSKSNCDFLIKFNRAKNTKHYKK